MSDFENKVISLFEQLNKAIEDLSIRMDRMEQRLDSIDQRFDELEKKIDDLRADMNDEFKAVRTKMEHESGAIRDLIRRIDNRLQNVESICSQRWNIPDISDRLSVVENVVRRHSGQISLINNKLGMAVSDL